MEFKVIEQNTPYSDFLKINDNNFQLVKKNIEDIWKVLTDNYLIDIDIVPNINFKKLFAVKDDSNIYNNWICDFNRLENTLNFLIEKGFNANEIIRTDFERFGIFKLDIPETIYFTKDYIDQVNKDWIKIDDLVSNLNSSLIFYGLKRKDN